MVIILGLYCVGSGGTEVLDPVTGHDHESMVVRSAGHVQKGTGADKLNIKT
jgi:hypothetical protein